MGRKLEAATGGGCGLNMLARQLYLFSFLCPDLPSSMISIYPRDFSLLTLGQPLLDLHQCLVSVRDAVLVVRL